MAETAESLVNKAEKRLQKSFFSFFSSDDKYEEATDLYVQAANQFKINKNWPKVAECYLKAAELQVKLNDKNAEANHLIEAANALKRYSFREAEDIFNKAIEIFIVQGRFMQSAKIYKTMAELFHEDGDYKMAINYYKKAADYSEMDEYGTSTHSQCILKYAELIALYQDNGREAIQIFEKQGTEALKKPLLQYSAKDHFFKAGIIYLAIGDFLDAKIAIEKYINLDSRVGNTSEMELLLKLVGSLEKREVDEFVRALQSYDRIHHLDHWKVHFFYKAKENILDISPPTNVDFIDTDQPDLT